MSWMYCLIAISLYFTSLSHHSDLFGCKYGGFGVPFYLRLQALTVKNECQFFNDRKRLVLNPLQSHFPVHQVMWKGLSLCSWVKLFFRGLAVHTEPLLTLAQSALCHRINQTSWPIDHIVTPQCQAETADVRTTCLASKEEINHLDCLSC